MNADDELIEPGGQGAELFDDPTVFYLTYREQIERWHALKDRANHAVDEYFTGLREDVETIAEQHELAAGLFKTSTQYRSFLLWPSTGQLPGDEGPALAIGLRWNFKTPAVDNAAQAPRVGLRVAPGQEQLREEFLTAGDPDTRHLRDQHGYKSNTRWPVFKTITGNHGWWADLDIYRDTLLRALEEVLSIFGERLMSTYRRT